MARVDDIGSVIAEKLYVGLSSIFGVTAIPFQSATVIKILSGNTLEIGGSYSMLNGASTAFTWGSGYVMGASEVLAFNATGNFYLAATGATVTALVLRMRGPCD